MATVVLLNPMGADVTGLVNNTFGLSLLKGTIMAPGDTLYTLPYVNQSGAANIENGEQLFDAKVRELAAAGEQVKVFGYSEGCQIIDLWITKNAAAPPIPADQMSVLCVGNANSKFGGFAYNHDCFNSVGFTGGLPDTVPWAYTMFQRQYDGVADFPGSPAIQRALVDTSTVAVSAAALQATMASVLQVVAYTGELQAAMNALVGIALVHNFYEEVAVDDPQNESFTDTSGVNYVWSPSSVVLPGGSRPEIEACYSRPVTLPT